MKKMILAFLCSVILVQTTNGMEKEDIEDSRQTDSLSQHDKNNALHTAVRRNQSVEVESWLRQGADVNAVMSDQYTYTSLHWAAYYGYTDIVSILLSYHANVNATDKFGRTPLHKAAYMGHDLTLLAGSITSQESHYTYGYGGPEDYLGERTVTRGVDYMDGGKMVKDQWRKIVVLLFTQNADVNIRDLDGKTPFDIGYNEDQKSPLLYPPRDGYTPLHRAVYKEDYEAASFLLARGADMNAVNNDGWTPLQLAVISCHYRFVPFLLANGADIKVRSRTGQTLLHIVGSSQEMFFYLLSNGADVNAVDIDGRTPLHSAIRSHGETLVSLLLGNGANVNARDSNGNTPLHRAQKMGWGYQHSYDKIVPLLLAHNADVTIRNADGETPLISTIRWWNGRIKDEIFSLFLARGADVNAADTQGETCLHHAVLNSHKEFITLLLINGADVNARNKNGNTLLHNAQEIKATSSSVYKGIVSLLLDYNADITLRNADGDTPLDVEIRKGRQCWLQDHSSHK